MDKRSLLLLSSASPAMCVALWQQVPRRLTAFIMTLSSAPCS